MLETSMNSAFYDSVLNFYPSHQKISRIACMHRLEDQVITESNEIVCKSCGVVLGMDNVLEASAVSTTNLFQDIQPGSKPVKIEAATRIHEQKSISSNFSNACSKLKLPRHAYLDAWRMYSKLDKNTNFSTAEKASFALFVSCRRHSIPNSDTQIQKSIKFAFSLNRMPTMLKVFSSVKITAKEELKIKCDDDNYLNYYLNLYSNKVPQQKRDEIRDMIMGLCTIKNNAVLENHHAIARFAFNMISRESKEFIKIRKQILPNETDRNSPQRIKKEKFKECY